MLELSKIDNLGPENIRMVHLTAIICFSNASTQLATSNRLNHLFILRYLRWNFCYNHWRSLATWQNDFLSFHYSAFFMLPVWCEKEFSKEVDAREKNLRHPTERRFLFDWPANLLKTLTQLINQFAITL